MRPVSTEFQEAVRQPVREDRIEGYLGLWDNERLFRSYHFDEEHIVQGSLTITDQLPGGKFGFGGAYTRNLSIKLDLDKFSDSMDRTLVNLTDGEIILFYYLTLEDGSEERVFLGQYFINSEKSSRKFNVLSIIAEDGLIKLDTPATAMEKKAGAPLSDSWAYAVYKTACAGIRGEPPNTQEFFNGLPNSKIALTYDTSQIQTNRDVLMWLGELTGTFLRECRDEWEFDEDSPVFNSPLGRPELVQIPNKYTQSGTSGNFDLEAFEEDNGSIIPADVRFSTDFSDTSIRILQLQMSRGGKMLVADHPGWDLAPDTLRGTLELSNNPLLDTQTETVAQTALNSISNYVDQLRFCSFKTTFNGNPAIEVGDYVYLEPGGAIDETQYNHYGIVTYYKWRFRGKCELRCSTDAVPSFTRPKNNEESVSMFSARTGEAQTQPSMAKTKSQTEKQIDGLKYRLTSAYRGTDKLEFTDVPALTLTVGGAIFDIGTTLAGYLGVSSRAYPNYRFQIDFQYARIGFADTRNGGSTKWYSIRP